MKKSILMKLLVLAVCAAMLLSLFACDNDVEDPTETPTQQQTEKPTQKPTEKPTEAPTQAPTAAPTDEPTEDPAETDPTETDPAETDPAETDPVVTDPVVTDRTETDPAETDPTVTDPVVTDPTETDPTETKPAETKPAETDPAETDPAETKPAETKPAETKPAETEPAETKPAETKPAETKPAETEPAETKPAETKPAETEPPVETDPPCDGNHHFVEKGDSGHYCDKCGKPSKDNMYDHTYAYVEDVYKCTGCGYEPSCKGVHAYESDADNHWIAKCPVCEAAAVAAEPHTGATVNGKYVCTVCEAELPCPETHVWGSDADGHWMEACSVCGAAATDRAPHNEVKVESVTDTAFIYGCKDCGYAFYTKTLTDKVAAFITPGNVHRNKADATKNDLSSSTIHQLTTGIAQETDGMPYVTMSHSKTDNVSQLIWNRAVSDKQGSQEFERYTFDVGQSKYLVIRARANMAADSKITLYISTVAFDGVATIVLPLVKPAENEDAKWVTYVIDLEKACGEKYAMAEGAEAYAIDSFFFHMQPFTTADALDIAYMAFVEGEWSDVDAYVDEETVVSVIASNTGSEVYTNTGKCVGEHSLGCVTEAGDEATTYTVVCEACDEKFATQTVPNSVNYFADYNSMNVYNGSIEKNQCEDGVIFNRYIGTGSHFLVSGGDRGTAGSLTSDKYATGKYVTFKYRWTDSKSYLLVHLATGDKKSGTGATHGELATAQAVQDEWRVVIADVSGNAQWTSDGSMQSIYAMFSVGTGTLDLAYFAVVDSYAEAASLMGANDKYMYDYGTSFASANATPILRNNKGECVHENVAVTSTPGDEATTYTATCLCGETIATKTVPNGVNYYADYSSMGIFNGSVATKAEDGVIFNRFTSKGSYVKITNSATSYGSLTTSQYQTGKYVTFKYRWIDTAGYNVLRLATGDKKSGDLGVSSGEQKGANAPIDEWRIAIVDVSGNAEWTSDGSEQSIYAMLQTAAGTLDIAYFAVVDSYAEAASLMGADDKYIYDYGTDFGSTTPTIKDKDGNLAPIEVIFDAEQKASVTVPANTTLNFEVPFGLSEGMILTANGTAIDFVAGSMMMRQPSTFSITNNTDAAVTYELVASFPVGSQMNPEAITPDENNFVSDGFALAEGNDQGYYYTFTAIEDGTVTLYFTDVPEGVTLDIVVMQGYAQKTLLADGVDNNGLELVLEVKAGDVLNIQVVVTPDENWNIPAAEATLNVMFAYPVGTVNNPFSSYEWNDSDSEANATVTIPAGVTYYFGGYSGMILTVNGEDYEMDEMGAFSITNDGEADAEYVIHFATPVGAENNPEVIEGNTFEDTNSLEADGSYYYIWTATENGTVTLTITDGANITANLLTYVEGEDWPISIQSVLAEPVTDPETFAYTGWTVAENLTIDVVAGQEIKIQINGLTDWATWTTPAIDYTFSFAFEKAPVIVEDLSEINDMAIGTKVQISGTVTAIDAGWNETSGYMSVYVTDEFGESILCYRLATKVTKGDIVTVVGEVGEYKSVKQIVSGKAEITDHDSSYDVVISEVTIAEAIELPDGTDVIVTGTVIKAGSWNSQYGNMDVTIKDEAGNELYIYRLATQVAFGDVIKVTGIMATHNGRQIGEGATAEKVGTHECTQFTEATCTAAPKCVLCGTVNGEALGHADVDPADGKCDRCGTDLEAAAAQATASKSISDLITSEGWTNTTTKQSFSLDDKVTVKVDGGSNSGKAYNGDHIRIYATDSPAGSLTISVAEGYELVSVKISTKTGTYAFITVDGATDISNITTAVSGSSVVLTSVKNGENGKQVQVTAIEVVYAPAAQ